MTNGNIYRTIITQQVSDRLTLILLYNSCCRDRKNLYESCTINRTAVFVMETAGPWYNIISQLCFLLFCRTIIYNIRIEIDISPVQKTIIIFTVIWIVVKKQCLCNVIVLLLYDCCTTFISSTLIRSRFASV